MSLIKKYYDIGKYKLYPLCRSITGKGTYKTLKIIKKEFPNLKIKSIPSQSKVFDWKVPHEWNISEAYIIDKFGKKIIDFKNNNLHLMSYSKPVNKMYNKKELFNHIYFLKKLPNAIPYATSYYKKRWGFCITYNDKKRFDKLYNKNDKFKVVIKSSLKKKGYLRYGELVLKGKSKQEILISTNICHPSMANNELSGPLVAMALINYFRKEKKLEKTLRFIFIPETIGSIVFLNQNLIKLKKNLIAGYTLTCIGDERNHSCIFSKYENSPSDYALIDAYKKLKIKKFKKYSFLDRGSDERQYNSPGVDLPISVICRTKFGSFPEYHTSLDDFNLVTLKGINGGFNVAKSAIKILLKKIYPKNKILCEPLMSKRNLYNTSPVKGKSAHSKVSRIYMNFLQYSDGRNSLEQISKKIKMNFNVVKKIYYELRKSKLIH